MSSICLSSSTSACLCGLFVNDVHFHITSLIIQLSLFLLFKRLYSPSPCEICCTNYETNVRSHVDLGAVFILGAYLLDTSVTFTVIVHVSTNMLPLFHCRGRHHKSHKRNRSTDDDVREANELRAKLGMPPLRM